ncbi:MAG: sigma 54-interacting transcriptional regulator [Deltaproteobacteria bacterium]|nr:sigma 54-interacting transcriptional regulator [Deltaproteobacteria bacterium]
MEKLLRSTAGVYHLIRKIGEGEFGAVWLATEADSKRDIALKFLKLEGLRHDLIERFKQEFSILAALRHPHLAKVFDFGFSEEDQQYFFTSEYFPGQDLFLATPEPTTPMTEEILVQILSALDYIHSQGVIHFDIKTQNVLATFQKGHPLIKLVDFGLASRLNHESRSQAGTLAYMAPEILSRSSKIDHRADLYSLGILLLRVLNRDWPFDIHDSHKIMQWHLKGDLSQIHWKDPLPPKHLQELILKLIAKNPSDRFSNARVVLNFLNLATGKKYLSTEKTLSRSIPKEGPLIEREEIMGEIQSHFRSCFFSATAKPLSSVILISGEQGIGKSRILEETKLFIQPHEIPTYELTCDWNIPTWPRLAQLLNLSEEEIPAVEEPLSIAGEESTEGWLPLRHAHHLMERARTAPFCLLLDDLHKAEPEMKETLSIVMTKSKLERKEGRGSPFLILATSQDSGGIRLPRLSEQGISQYCSHLLGQQEKIREVAHLLKQYSGGLPLLVVEGLQFLAPDFFEGKKLDEILPPPQFSLLYRDRLEMLSGQEREAIQIAALLFRPSSEKEFSEILHLSEKETGPIFEKMVRSGLIRKEMGPSKISYELSSQALALEMIKTIEPEKKKGLHQKIALGLEKQSEKSIEELAYHFASGGEKEKAQRLYEEAARELKEKGLISQAVECLKRASSLCEEESSRADTLRFQLVRLLALSGSFREAQEKAKKLPKNSSVEQEEIKGWLAFKLRRFSEAQASYESALNLLPPSPSLKKVLLYNALANVDLQTGDVDGAIRLFKNSLKLEKDLPHEEQSQIHNNNLGLALSLHGQTDEAIRFAEDRLLRVQGRSTPEAIHLLNNLGFVLLGSSRYGEAIEKLRRALELSEKTGAHHLLFTILGNLTTAYLKENRYPESLSILQKMVSYQERLGTTRDIAFNWLRQGSVYLTLGMKEISAECFSKGKELADENQDQSLQGWILLMQGYWEREFGSSSSAEKVLNEARSLAQKSELPDLLLWIEYALADLDYENGEITSCEKRIKTIEQKKPPSHDEEFLARIELLKAKLDPSLCEPLERFCQQHGFREILWELYHTWGLHKKKEGSLEQAASLMKKGIDIIESIVQLLPEEYRDRYRQQQSRKKLEQDWKEVSAMAQEQFLSRLLEVNKKMVSEHDPQRLLEFIMDTAIELSGAEEGFLLLPDGQGGFEPKIARNIQKENLEAIQFSQSVAKEVLRTGQALFSLNAFEDLKAFKSVISLELKTVACVPLKAQNKVIGVIYLDTEKELPPLKREVLPVLEAFADQAAIALKNAWLFQERETYSQKLAEDLSDTKRVVEEQSQQIHELASMVSQKPRRTLFPYERIIGKSKKIEEVLKTLDKVTNTQVPIFIFGETGSGKELLARALHENSVRKAKSFVAINCSAFPETILESELFGYYKGAFTGADQDRKGLFEEANEGTLFLDEIGEMSLAMQAKLLRVIQEKEIMRVGGRTPIKINVRIVSASNKDLKKMVREGKFREDLYFRIAGMTLTLPPLRERKEDIPLLVKHFVEKIKKENRLPKNLKFSREAMNTLILYPWPGNIRELEQCLTNACLLAEGSEIKAEHIILQKDLYEKSGEDNLARSSQDVFLLNPEKKWEDYEREILLKTLDLCGGNKSEAARRLGLSRLTLHKKIKAYEIPDSSK